jgi:hypothetical protein
VTTDKSELISFSFVHQETVLLLVQNADVSKLLYLESSFKGWRCEVGYDNCLFCLVFSKGAVELQLSLLRFILSLSVDGTLNSF